MPNNIKISLKSKPETSVTILISDEVKSIVQSSSITPSIHFIATGERGVQGEAGTASINDNSITTSHIEDSSVTNSKIANGSVSTSKLGYGAVTTSKINSGAVTTQKIADSSISASKLKPNSVNASHIQNGTIIKELISDLSLPGGKLEDDSIGTIKILDNAVTKDKIASKTISGAEMEDNIILGGTTHVVSIQIDGSSPGYINGPNEDLLYIKSKKDLIFVVDSDENSHDDLSSFKFQDFAGTNLLELNESGHASLSGDLNVQGNINVSGLVDGIDISSTLVSVANNLTKLNFIGITQSVDLDAIETDVNLNTAKKGITTSQADAITANTAKPDLTVENAGTVHPSNYTDTNTQLTQEQVEDYVGDLIENGTKTGINVTYDDDNDAINMVVDHDAATNFVAEEHYRWDNDIQSTATINHLNLSIDTPVEAEVLVMNDGDAVWGHPEKIHLQVRNDEGATIPAGAPLYSKVEIGGSGRIKVGICDADDSAKMPCIGLAEAEMNTSSTKDNFAITQGVYNTNISGFTGLTIGDTLYVDTSGSAPHLTKTKPTGESSLIQNVGIVLKTNGSTCQGLQVSAIGRTNDVPNLNSGYVFYGNGSNQAVSTQLSTLLPPDLTVNGAGIIDVNNVPTLNQNTTGNAATATTLTAGNKTIDGNLDIGANQAGHDLNLYGANLNNAIAGWVSSANLFKFTDSTKLGFGTANQPGAVDSFIQANGNNLVISNTVGNIQIGDTVEITGDLTISGTVDGIDIATDVAANTLKTSFPGFGTTAGTALAGNTTIPTQYTDALAVHAVENTALTLDNDLNVDSNFIYIHDQSGSGAKSRIGTETLTGNQTVYLPDAGGTIATTNKLIDTKVAAYWSSSTGGFYVPLSGATFSENTSLSTASYALMYIVPYDGKILRISSFHQNAASGTSTFEVYIDGDDSDLTNDQRGSDMTTSSFTRKFTEDCPTDWTFSKGEAIAIKRTDSVARYGVTMTVVFEFDTTT